MRKFLYLFLIFPFTYSCKSQSQNARIVGTTENIIQSISDSNFNDFRNLIAVAPGKDESMIAGDFKRCCYYYRIYSKSFKIKKVIYNDINDIAQKREALIFFEGNDTVNNIKKFGIELFYGPPNLFPLEKISGYNILFEMYKVPDLIAPSTLH